jgi:hypothetical protein
MRRPACGHGDLQESEAWTSGPDVETSDDLDSRSKAAMSCTVFSRDLQGHGSIEDGAKHGPRERGKGDGLCQWGLAGVERRRASGWRCSGCC